MLRSRIVLFAALISLALCQVGFAQYGGSGPMPNGTTPAPGTPGYTAPSGGYKANPALIGGLVAGAAVGGGAIWYAMHHRNMFKGCVGPDGKTLVRDDGQRFQLEDSTLTPGERVSLKAKKSDDGSTLDVQDVQKDYGRCEQVAKSQ